MLRSAGGAAASPRFTPSSPAAPAWRQTMSQTLLWSLAKERPPTCWASRLRGFGHPPRAAESQEARHPSTGCRRRRRTHPPMPTFGAVRRGADGGGHQVGAGRHVGEAQLHPLGACMVWSNAAKSASWAWLRIRVKPALCDLGCRAPPPECVGQPQAFRCTLMSLWWPAVAPPRRHFDHAVAPPGTRTSAVRLLPAHLRCFSWQTGRRGQHGLRRCGKGAARHHTTCTCTCTCTCGRAAVEPA